MLAYAYEAGKGKSKVASVISFHALGWLAGIVAAGIANDEKLIFVVSSGFFIIGFLLSLKLPKLQTEKIIGKGIIKKIIVKNKFLFSSLLIRHIGAAAAWTVLPIMLMEYFGAELYPSLNRICSKYTNSISCNEFNVKKNSNTKYHKI